MSAAEGPTAYLLIGLGGLGFQAVRHASQLVARRGPGGHPGPVLCLGIDTDRTVLTDERLHAYEGLLLETGEFGSVMARPQDYPPVKDWLPGDLPILDPGRGVRGSRPLGRLAFFLHRRELERRITGTLARLGGADPAHPVECTPGSLQVLVASSLGGGTGSGMLCDLTYLIHRLVHAAALPCSFTALLVMGARPPRDEAISANVFAGMVELNHWMAHDSRYSYEYSSGERWETDCPPFEQVFLVAGNNLADEASLPPLFDQVAAQVGLWMWDDFAAVRDELNRRHHSYFRGTDLRGNPVCYFSCGSATLSLPLGDLRLAAHARLAAQVVNRWRTTLFHAGSGTSGDEERAHAESFLKSQELHTNSFRRVLRNALNSAFDGRFDLDRQTRRLAEGLARTPKFGVELVRELTELDESLSRQIASDAPDGAIGFLEQQTTRFLQERSQDLVNELSSFFRAGREQYLGFCVFLDELSERIGHCLNDLHEALNSGETAEMRLKDEKVKAIEEAAHHQPGLLDRWLRKVSNEPVERCLQALKDYHENRVRLCVDRQSLNAYLGLLDTLQRFSNGVNELLEYLDAVESELRSEEGRARGRLFAVPGEVLLTATEVEEFICEQCSPDRVSRATEELLAQVGQDLFSVPRTIPRAAWLGRILQVLQEGNSSPAPDVLTSFLAHHPGEAARDQIRILFERARPSMASSLAIPDYEPGTSLRVAYIGLKGGEDTDSEAGRTFLEHLSRLPTDNPVKVLPLSTPERVAFLRVSGGFPLDALDLHSHRRAYLQTLRLSRRGLHVRTDVRWRALGRPSASQVRILRESLAIGLHLGMLTERTRGPGDQIDRLESPRWPDLTALKSCLRLYADPLEALHVEGDFLAALHRWQDQRLDETGAEGYRRSLTADLRPLRFLGLDLDQALKDGVASFDERLEEKWPQWSRAIQRALQQEPSVATSDLISVPIGVRRWALLRFLQEHPEENLTYHAVSGKLELVSARDVETLERTWRRVQESAEADPEAFSENARALIGFLCTSLGFTPGEGIGLGNLRGIRVGTHGLRIKIPSRIPILVSRVPVLSQGDVEALRSLMEQGGPDSRFGLLLTLGDAQQNIQIIDEHLRTLLRYDVIVLTQMDLREVLRVRWRLKALVARILEQVDLTVVSPFVTEGPVPSSMFFGREGEIKEIVHRIETSSLALVGPRRIGKTSILQRVLASLRNRPRPVVYLDCQSIYDASSFLLTLASEYVPAQAHDDLSSPSAFRGLLDALRAGYAGAPVQFILDEVDLVLREDPEGAEGLFRAFRGAEGEEAAHFLFCGERTLLHKLRDPNSALFNFCHTMRVQFLEPRDAARLIAEPLEQMEVRWEDRDSSIERILEITSSHPNLIQRTCANLVEVLNRERTRMVKREHLDEVVADPSFLEDYLDTLWGRASETEKILILALEPDETASPPELRRRLQEDFEIELPAPSVVEAMENLCLYGILEKRGSRYQFAARHLPHLMREVMDVAEEIQLHKEMMLHGG